MNRSREPERSTFCALVCGHFRKGGVCSESFRWTTHVELLLNPEDFNPLPFPSNNNEAIRQSHLRRTYTERQDDLRVRRPMLEPAPASSDHRFRIERSHRRRIWLSSSGRMMDPKAL
jgi:hypothetical protein